MRHEDRSARRPASIRMTAMAAVAATALAGFGACSNDRSLGKDIPQGKGAVIGAVAGAAAAQVIGKDVGALGTILAAAAGAYIGSKVLDKDKLDQSLAQNQPATLTTESGEQLRIEPAGTVQQGDRTCRQFTITRLNAPAGTAPSTATACEDTGGQWRLASAQ